MGMTDWLPSARSAIQCQLESVGRKAILKYGPFSLCVDSWGLGSSTRMVPRARLKPYYRSQEFQMDEGRTLPWKGRMLWGKGRRHWASLGLMWVRKEVHAFPQVTAKWHSFMALHHHGKSKRLNDLPLSIHSHSLTWHFQMNMIELIQQHRQI